MDVYNLEFKEVENFIEPRKKFSTPTNKYSQTSAKRGQGVSSDIRGVLIFRPFPHIYRDARSKGERTVPVTMSRYFLLCRFYLQ